MVNQGQEPHEMAIIRADGFTVGQVREFIMTPPGEAPAGPPPYTDAGGFQAIMPGDSGWAVLNLPAGDYFLLCFIPSPANEFAPHAVLGMIRGVKVQ